MVRWSGSALCQPPPQPMCCLLLSKGALPGEGRARPGPVARAKAWGAAQVFDLTRGNRQLREFGCLPEVMPKMTTAADAGGASAAV